MPLPAPSTPSPYVPSLFFPAWDPSTQLCCSSSRLHFKVLEKSPSTTHLGPFPTLLCLGSLHVSFPRCSFNSQLSQGWLSSCSHGTVCLGRKLPSRDLGILVHDHHTQLLEQALQTEKSYLLTESQTYCFPSCHLPLCVELPLCPSPSTAKGQVTWFISKLNFPLLRR